MYKIKWPLQDGANGDGDGAGGDGGGGDSKVIETSFTADTAREYLKDRVADADALATYDEAKLLKAATEWKAREEKQPFWRDNWREAYAKGQDGKVDQKKLERLQRYATPAAMFDALFGVQQKISAGELRSTLPKNATEEQIKAWRAENGIPEAPEKYELKLKDGLTIGEADKPLVDGFLKVAHAAGLSNQAASQTVEWYYDMQERQAEEREAKDKEIQQASTDKLRTEWGQEYRANINGIHALLDTAPAGVKEGFLAGRLADGTPIGSSVEILSWLDSLRRQINPVSTVVPGASAQNIGSAIEDEIASIEKVMRENRSAYNADEKMQARLRELYGARERLGSK